MGEYWAETIKKLFDSTLWHTNDCVWSRKCKYISFILQEECWKLVFFGKMILSSPTHFIKRCVCCTDTVLKVCVQISCTHRFNNRCKIEQRFNRFEIFSWYSLWQQHQHWQTYYSHFHSVSMRKQIQENDKKIIPTHEYIELNMCLQIYVSMWVWLCVFFVRNDLAQMHSKLVTIKTLSASGHVHTHTQTQRHTDAYNAQPKGQWYGNF